MQLYRLCKVTVISLQQIFQYVYIVVPSARVFRCQWLLINHYCTAHALTFSRRGYLSVLTLLAGCLELHLFCKSLIAENLQS